MATILVPVMASVLVLTAAGLYLVWICKLRGTIRLLHHEEQFRHNISALV